MNAKRFDEISRWPASVASRRAALQAIVAGALGARAVVATADEAAAKRSTRRKRRRRARARARARCLAACGPACAICAHTPDEEILCGQDVTPGGGCPFCEADADCPLGQRCVATVQERGSARRERFIQCLYPNGLCAEIVACAP
jgi:hypothetical protein